MMAAAVVLLAEEEELALGNNYRTKTFLPLK